MRNIHLGIDFDNTLVLYDEIFYDLALEEGFIHKNIPANKVSIREEMILNGKENEFTEMQGEVYGNLIKNAKPQKDLSQTLNFLLKKGIKISIVSHKTKFPIKGKKYDLHQAALNWLITNNFFEENFIGMKLENVYFEETIDQKIQRIKDIHCTHFIDDLEKVLEKLDKDIIKILFTNKTFKTSEQKNFLTLNGWNDIYDII